MRRLLLTVVPLLLLVNFAHGGKYNPTLSVGDAAPVWKELPGVDGKPHSLADLKEPAVVVVFTCNTCPTALDYESRLIALVKKFGADGKVAVVAINSNDLKKSPDDSLEKMQARAKAQGFNFAYVRDDSQEVARAFGATYTPEFFVLDKQRKIAYMGALDDATNPAEVKTKFVEDALTAVLSDQAPATQETVARGCAVRYGRTRAK